MGMMNKSEFKNWKPGDVVKPVLVCGPGLTKQEFAKEADINYVMKRFNATGHLPVDMSRLQPVFADVSSIGSYADVVFRAQAANEAFAALDPKIRSRFDNNPVKLIEFLQDEKK